MHETDLHEALYKTGARAWRYFKIIGLILIPLLALIGVGTVLYWLGYGLLLLVRGCGG